ncbi:MAG: hypothetical protein ACNS62_05135 [Candidatus Cyclobacteriaceae bacterium M3_2C_046]
MPSGNDKTFGQIFKIIKVFAILSLFQCQPNDSPGIKIWYGLEQNFGRPGNAQRQINVLGNIEDAGSNTSVYYQLNHDTTRNFLTLGSDLHRLAQPGDFNIDIDRDLLFSGKNRLTVFLLENDQVRDKKEIIINYDKDQNWPLPYEVDWRQTDNIFSVVQVIDGHWELSDAGIRTIDKYYDRMIAVGDHNWRNYEVYTTVVFHDYTSPAPGPPTYNVTHVAIATRWPGHDLDSLQPDRKWYPLGATSEFRITDNYDSCRWRIFDGENFYEEQPQADYRQIEPEQVYHLKHRVVDQSDSTTLYSVKLWYDQQPEPAEWDFQALEINRQRESGSACLIAHHTDVTFGNLKVEPVKRSE